MFRFLFLSAIFFYCGCLLAQDNYVDYFPKFRTEDKKVFIPKIEYKSDTILIDVVIVGRGGYHKLLFFPALDTSSWYLTNTVISKYQHVAKRFPLHIRDVRLDHEVKKKNIAAGQSFELTYSTNQLVRFQLVATGLSKNIRTLFLMGDMSSENPCMVSDILIKSARSSLLGNNEMFLENTRNMCINAGLSHRQMSSYLEDLTEQTGTKRINRQRTPMQVAVEPIDYMPKVFKKVEDIECNQRLVLENVYFKDDLAQFDSRIKSLRSLSSIARHFKENIQYKIVLHGHTDIFGDPLKNLELSKQRVLMVKRSLVSMGVRSNRIVILYHGGTQPLIQFKDGGARNRRVEMEAVCDTKSS